MTVEAFTDYVILVSTQVAAEPTAQPILDANMAVRVLLPAVLREVIRRTVKNGGQIKNLIYAHRLKVAGNDSSARLPAGVREEFAEMMMVGRSDNDLGLFSWIPHYSDYVRETNPMLPQFTLRGGKLYARLPIPPDAENNPTVGDLTLYALTEPEIPTDGEIEIDEAMMDDCLTLTASILRGEVSLATLNLDNTVISRSK